MCNSVIVNIFQILPVCRCMIIKCTKCLLIIEQMRLHDIHNDDIDNYYNK